MVLRYIECELNSIVQDTEKGFCEHCAVPSESLKADNCLNSLMTTLWKLIFIYLVRGLNNVFSRNNVWSVSIYILHKFKRNLINCLISLQNCVRNLRYKCN
jgi:hypothetical protein